ncbi:MAG TPA: family 78 glycoside hydrolase catalytic domain [Verrucomicrobiae bacterium]
MKTFFIASFTFAVFAFQAVAGLAPVDLRCDYSINPLGVDSESPRLFWQLPGNQRGQKQIAYEILVSSSSKLLAGNSGDLWDSGKIPSGDTIQIDYAGRELSSFQRVVWKVRVWDGRGNVSESKPAGWTMGVLQRSDWHANWISAPNAAMSNNFRFRRELLVKPNLKCALVNICGLGQYELSLNGKKIGNDFLSPGWTKYDQTCLYDTFDVTKNLVAGNNAVGVELGNGMYNVIGGGRFTKFKRSFGAQKVIAQIRLEYDDGRVEFVGTGEDWQVAPGPITFDSIYGGEDEDARLAQNNWNRIGFNDSKWQRAEIVEGPGGELRGLSCAAPPVREFEIHQPVAHWTLANGDQVFDLGQNASHVPKISVSGLAGGSVKIFPSELTNLDGSVNQSSMGGGHRGYICCGFTKATDRVETWSPKFFYAGCRYLQIHSSSAQPGGDLPKIESVAGIVIHSASRSVGEFECSNDLFNRIFKLVRWAQQNNTVSILTDCPHRERLGWLEQDHLNGPSLRYDFDLSQLFTKIVNDISDSQLTNGLVPTTAPEYAIFRGRNDASRLRNDFGDSPEWSSSFILIPWQQYKFDGDLSLFRKHYDGMKHYLAYLGSRATNSLVNYGLGDWYDLGPNKPGVSQLTPVELTATAFYFEDAKILSQAADLLGYKDDAMEFSRLAEKIRAAFNQQFYDPTNRLYATGSQCADAIPLVFGLCDSSNRSAIVDAIVRNVRENGLTAGDVGYRYLLRALADGGRSDVIFDLNNQTNKPGYGMQIAKGKTSLTEAWDGGSSQDHFMLGQIQEWFFHDLAGIQNAPESVGFQKIVIAPQIVGDLKWVRASYDSIHGKIVSSWKRDGGKLTLEVLAPPNTTAEVFVPTKDSTIAIKNAGGGKFVRTENGCAVFEIGSGDYTFESRF